MSVSAHDSRQGWFFTALTGAVLVASRHGQDAGVRPLSLQAAVPGIAWTEWRAEGGRGQLSRSSVVMRVAAGTKKVQIAEDTFEHQIQQRSNATRSDRKRAMFSARLKLLSP